MKRLIVLILLGLSLSACVGGSAPGGGPCQGGVCIRLRVAEPVYLNVSAIVTITVQSNEQIPGLTISLVNIYPSVLVDGERRWTIDTLASQAMTVSSIIRFTEEGYYHIIVQASDRRIGLVVADDATIHVTRAGATVYYSGTPIPITPGPAPTTAPALRTLLAQPTSTRTPTLIPTPTRAPYP